MSFRRILFKLLIVLAIGVAVILLYRSFSRFTLDEIGRSVSALPWSNLAYALGFAAASYLCLGCFDALAVRYAGKPLPLRKTALASFCGLSIGHNVGIAALSSGAVRYRFYSRWGLTNEEIGKVIVFCGVTVGLGLITLAGMALLLVPQAVQALGFGGGLSIGIGFLCVGMPTVYVAMSVLVRRTFHVWTWEVTLPEWRLALGQIAVGTVNFACVAACLHQLLRAFTDAGYLQVASVYVTANLAALVSHVPGGLGVLEATVMHLIGSREAIGALVVFRVLYFFVPLALGLPLFIGSEIYFRVRKPATKENRPKKRVASVPT